MTVPAQLLIAAALVATAVILGTDVFAAIVLRAALACVGDRTPTGYPVRSAVLTCGIADGSRALCAK